MRVVVIAVAIGAVLLIGVGAMALGYFEPPSAVTVAPQESVVFTSIAINPSLSQRRALSSLVGRLPDEARENITESLPEMLDEVFEEADVDYVTDIAPWLGGEIAGFVLPGESEPAGAVIIATTDTEAAVTFLRSSAEEEMGGEIGSETYRGVEYSTAGDEVAFAGINEFLVVGTPAGVEASVDASLDGGLAMDEEFAKLDGALNDDRLLSYFVDSKGLLELAKQTGDLTESELDRFTDMEQFGSLGKAFERSNAGAVWATQDSVVFEAVTTIPDDRDEALALTEDDADLLASLPASTWLGAAFPHLGASVEQLLSDADMESDVDDPFADTLGMDLREDVLAWMQDATLFVIGEDVETLGGGVVVGSDDAAATNDLVDQISDYLAEQQVPTKPASHGDLEGFTIEDPELPVTATVLGGDQFVVAVDQAGSSQSSTGEMLAEGPRLADDATYHQATNSLGVDFVPRFYVDITRAFAVAESALGEASGDDEMREAEPYIDVLSYLIVGAREDGDLSLHRAVLSTKAP